MAYFGSKYYDWKVKLKIQKDQEDGYSATIDIGMCYFSNIFVDCINTQAS